MLELNGPRWGLHLNAAKCELAAHPASSHRSSVFPDLPGSNKNTEGNFHMLGSPVGTTEFRRQFLLDNAIEHAEDSLEAITNLENPQVALSLIRHCTGFCQMVYSLRTTPNVGAPGSLPTSRRRSARRYLTLFRAIQRRSKAPSTEMQTVWWLGTPFS